MPTRTFNQNSYKHGGYNVICDVCGFKFKNCDIQERWDGLKVCPDDYEVRHVSDFFRVDGEDPSVPWSRPDDDTGTNLVTDPGFLDYTKWAITTLAGSAEVVGGMLRLIDFEGTVTGEAVAPIASNDYQYQVTIESVTGVNTLGMQYGSVTVWTPSDGDGHFSGTFTASNTVTARVSLPFAAVTADISLFSIFAVDDITPVT